MEIYNAHTDTFTKTIWLLQSTASLWVILLFKLLTLKTLQTVLPFLHAGRFKIIHANTKLWHRLYMLQRLTALHISKSIFYGIFILFFFFLLVVDIICLISLYLTLVVEFYMKESASNMLLLLATFPNHLYLIQHFSANYRK